jgi:hypothetical protein
MKRAAKKNTLGMDQSYGFRAGARRRPGAF